MAFTVNDLSSDLSYGAIVSDLHPAEIADPDVRKRLYDLWVNRGVIVFRGTPAEPDVQIALSEVFGDPEPHPLRDMSREDGFPKLADVYYRPDEGDITRFDDGSRLGAWLPWHFDLFYLPRINHGGILRALTKPEGGGETGFIDRILAYNSLPADLKKRIDGLYGTYVYQPDNTKQRYGSNGGAVLERMHVRSAGVLKRMELPPVAHPLVFVQPETGRKMLNFSPWYATGIEGMDQAEADSILVSLVPYATDETSAYYHEWQGDEMVLWDNWRMLHCACGVQADKFRHMQRTTITGDYGVGRYARPSEQTSKLYQF
jgi:taurine dioxygenase